MGSICNFFSGHLRTNVLHTRIFHMLKYLCLFLFTMDYPCVVYFEMNMVSMDSRTVERVFFSHIRQSYFYMYNWQVSSNINQY